MAIACDSGDIHDEGYAVTDHGKTVKMTARLTGVSSWEGTGYGVALAGFSSNSKYAVMQRAIPSNTEEGAEIEIILNNLSGDINTVELAITNKLRERIISLASIQMDAYAENGPTDTIRLDVGSLAADQMGCMQYGLFNHACIQCHGGNGRKAGNLDLTSGNAYGELVNKASTQKAGETRVMGGNPENSLLWKILNEGGENLLHYNHTEVLSSQFKENLEEVKELIRRWINSLPIE